MRPGPLPAPPDQQLDPIDQPITKNFPALLALVALVPLAACAKSDRAGRTPPDATLQTPEPSSGWTDKPGWTAEHWMVAAANPLAATAGAEMLQAGGSAIDAAIAVELVLTLVEPQSSGIGGGAFLLHWDGRTVTAFDGRETAPAAATESLFLRDGKPMQLYDGVVGGRSVGVPGILRMLEEVHRRFGKLPWSRLFEPAIELAENGFAISPRLATLLAAEKHLSADPAARAYFYDAQGIPRPAGSLLRNPQLAAVLRELAARGADAFYSGPIADAIVAKVRDHPRNPGLLTLADLAAYRPKERTPLCFDYRRWRVCGFPPPSSGGLAVGQILGILESTDISAHPPKRLPSRHWSLDPLAVHLFAEAGRLAYADRARYLADPDFVDVPVAGLLAPSYLAQRAALVGHRSIGVAGPGSPQGAPVAMGLDRSADLPSTSQISIVDAHGNALSMTATIEDGFGSRQMVLGFLLNNQLTDFSFAPTDEAGRPIANRVQPGKRPRSSMSPLLVFDRADGRFLMTLGSPGGSAIINYVAKVLVATLDWNLDLQTAISLPNFGSRNGPTELEAGRIDDSLAAALRARGHDVVLLELNSGVQAVERTSSGWFGAADPRREGVAMGE
ncbi:MAG: gamma-glutamyltransferase [Deltaproteobacteria bacterium]|nr:gamma-glutamyltransferase [Deltaproteobacteria bacterium]